VFVLIEYALADTTVIVPIGRNSWIVLTGKFRLLAACVGVLFVIYLYLIAVGDK